jgi:hypothetical protein
MRNGIWLLVLKSLNAAAAKMPPHPSASTGPRGNSAHLRNKGRQKTIFQQLSFSHDYFQSNFAEEFVHKDLQKDHRPPLLESAKNPSRDRRSDPRSSRYQERQSRDSLEKFEFEFKEPIFPLPDCGPFEG